MSVLSDLRNGEKAHVASIDPQCGIRQRLMDIGLVHNSEVECLGRSPGGDPIAYLICGAVIAIRKEDAAMVEVETWT